MPVFVFKIRVDVRHARVDVDVGAVRRPFAACRSPPPRSRARRSCRVSSARRPWRCSAFSAGCSGAGRGIASVRSSATVGTTILCPRGGCGCTTSSSLGGRAVAADDRPLERVVLDLFGQRLARHLDEIRLLFLDERRAVLHAETQDLLVVSCIAGRAIFHRLLGVGMVSERSHGFPTRILPLNANLR